MKLTAVPFLSFLSIAFWHQLHPEFDLHSQSVETATPYSYSDMP